MIYNDNYVSKYGPTIKPIVYDIDDNGCWNCVSHMVDSDGYPKIRRNMRNMSMCRYIYELNNGEIPSGMLIRHTCDNRLCINPDHLLLGTPLDNNMDKIKRNRQAYGELQGPAKLTEFQVRKIKLDQRPVVKIAKDYHVSSSTIWRIKAGVLWTHVKVEEFCPCCNGTGLKTIGEHKEELD